MTAGIKSLLINVASSWQIRQQLVSWMVTKSLRQLHRFHFQIEISQNCVVTLTKVVFYIATLVLRLSLLP